METPCAGIDLSRGFHFALYRPVLVVILDPALSLKCISRQRLIRMRVVVGAYVEPIQIDAAFIYGFKHRSAHLLLLLLHKQESNINNKLLPFDKLRE